MKTEMNDSGEINGGIHSERKREGWVKFDDDSAPTNTSSQEVSTAAVVASTSTQSSPQLPAVLNTETVQVNLDRGDKHSESVSHGTLSKNVEFVTIRQGFCKYLALNTIYYSYLINLMSST